MVKIGDFGGFWDSPSENFQALPPFFIIVFCRLWYELTYIEKGKKVIPSFNFYMNKTNISWTFYYIFYTNTRRNSIWFLDGPQITTITATHDDFFNIYYRQGEHFLKEFLAISIPSFLRNPNRSGLVNPWVQASASR
jgi:hypothetical protein